MIELTQFDHFDESHQPTVFILDPSAVLSVSQFRTRIAFGGSVDGARLRLANGTTVDVWESAEEVTRRLAKERETPSSPQALTLKLPWPPSVNRYWRFVGGKPLISKPGRQYREAVGVVWFVETNGRRKPLTGRLAVAIETHQPPDHRDHDLDNLFKAPLDAMQTAGVYLNDAQIDQLTITRGPTDRAGSLAVTISEKGGPE
jgi:crossover junction endodeoxyribonuclease RusA